MTVQIVQAVQSLRSVQFPSLILPRVAGEETGGDAKKEKVTSRKSRWIQRRKRRALPVLCRKMQAWIGSRASSSSARGQSGTRGKATCDGSISSETQFGSGPQAQGLRSFLDARGKPTA